MSNFQILENGPVASPGNCGICGYSGSDRNYIDPRQDFEFYGTFIICFECVGAMANDAGFLQPAQARSLENRVEEAERELIVLRSAILKLEDVHDLIAGFNADSGRGDSSNGSVVNHDATEQVGDSSESVGGTQLSFDEVGEGDSPADDDNRQQGSDDLSSLINSADDLLKL